MRKGMDFTFNGYGKDQTEPEQSQDVPEIV